MSYMPPDPYVNMLPVLIRLDWIGPQLIQQSKHLSIQRRRGEPGSAVEQLVRVYDCLQYPDAVKWAKGTQQCSHMLMSWGRGLCSSTFI